MMTTLANTAHNQEYLTQAREAELVARAQAGDKRARDALVMSHIRLVTALAAKYKAHHDFDDLVSVGTIGLVTAVDKFKTGKGARFGTYCLWHIRAEMFKLMQRESNIVSFGDSASKKRTFFGLAKAKRRLGIYGEPTDSEIKTLAADLEVTEDDVRTTLVRKAAVRSLNVHVVNKAGAAALDTLQDHLEDTSLVPADEMLIAAEEKTADTDALADALTTLKPNERFAVERRLLTDDPDTLDTLAKEKGRSRERIRQWQERGQEKIAAHLGRARAVAEPSKPKRVSRAKRDERIEFVKRNMHRMSVPELATALRVTPTTVRAYLRRIERERGALPLAA